jgi:autotransporter-associated beta strand protein
VDVNQLTLGIQPTIDAGGGQGTLNVDGTGLLVVNESLTMGRYTGKDVTTVDHKALGILNIGTISGGGAVTISGDVICGDAGGNIITLADGALTLRGKLGEDTAAGDAPLETLLLKGGTLTFDLGATPNPTGSRAKVATLDVPEAATISVTGTNLSTGRIELIKYSTFDSATQFANLNLELSGLVTGVLVNNTSNSSVDLEILTISTNKWSGAINGDWDINTTSNWVLSPANTPKKYLQPGIPGEAVNFDDAAIGTKTVNLTTTLSPGAIKVDTAQTYTFAGIGAISGPADISKTGAGTLVIENSGINDFAGEISIAAGRLRIGGSDDRLPINGSVTLSDVVGTELDLNHLNQTLRSLNGGGTSGGQVKLGGGALTITGAGSHSGTISGTGTLAKSGTGTQVLTGANLYTGGTNISGGRLAVANSSGSGLGTGPVVVSDTGVLAFGAGEAPGSIAATSITNNGRVAFNSNEDFTFSKLVAGIGSLAKENTINTVILETANPYSGATFIFGGGLRVTHPQALGTFEADPLNPTVAFNTTINNDPSSRLELEGDITLLEPITVANKGGAITAPAVLNVTGENTLAGPITLNTGGSFWTFESDDGKLTITGTMTNIATSNTRTLRLTGAALGVIQSDLGNSSGNLSLTGVTKEGTGTWTLAGNNTHTGPTAVNGGTLLITNSHAASPITVAYGATLGGNGTVGSLTSGGAIAPGVGIGTLTAAAATLTGILEIEVNGGSSDSLNVAGTLAMNASTVNISGTPVASSYILATAAEITGSPTLETAIPGYELVVENHILKLKSTAPGTPYSSWTTVNSLNGNNSLPATDVENDGLENLLEFVLGGNPNSNDVPSVRPVIVEGASAITLTFKRAKAAALQPVVVSVQVSNNTTTWNPANDIVIGGINGSGPNGATYTVTSSGDFDNIVVTIPKNGAATKFARVRAVMP